MLDLDPKQKILFYAFVWAGLIIISLYRMGSYGRTVGLPFAFLAASTFAYGGVLVHLVDDFDPSFSPYLRSFGYSTRTVAEGFEAACLGMVAVSVGSWVVASKVTDKPRPLGQAIQKSGPQLAKLLMSIGFGAFLFSLVIARLEIRLDGVQALLVAVMNCFIVGACGLIAFKHKTSGAQAAAIWTAMYAVVTPAVLLLTTAILADSVAASFCIVSFYLTLQTTPKGAFLRRVMVFSLVSVFCFMFAAGYLQSRQLLRNVVWSGGSVSAALDTAVDVASKFNPASAGDFETLALIDGRLDQSVFVGLAIEHLRGTENYGDGETAALAVLGWVPRFLWPGKPQSGGSRFLSRYTGLTFSEGTTFGTGPVFEFYVDFGLTGVFVGFLLLGGILRYFDLKAYQAVRADAMVTFGKNVLMALPLIAPLASLFFLVSAVAAAFLVGQLLGRLPHKNLNWSEK